MGRFSDSSNPVRPSWKTVSRLLLLVVLTLPVVYYQQVRADLTGPQKDDQIIAKSVAALLRQQHLSKHPLDDEISRRWLKKYLESLDPMKVYFTQADVDEFNKYRDQLDDMASRGDLSFGYLAFNRFLTRIEERANLAEQLLKEPRDFTIDEEMIIEPDETAYAKNDAETRELWRKKIKFDLLVHKYDALQEKKKKEEGKDSDKGAVAVKKDLQTPEEKVLKHYRTFVKRMKQTDNDELLELYLSAMTNAYDPHTSYLSKDSLNNFEIQMRLNLEGIGAALRATEDAILVEKIIRGGAADKEGSLKKGDKVVGVAQENGPMINVTDMKLKNVVNLIRGQPGTHVRLEVIPENQTEHKVYTITRATIELEDSAARSEIIEDGKKLDGTPYRIGVINLPSFYMDMSAAKDGTEEYRSTTRDVARLLREFNEKKVDVVVLDLRLNGGGSLNEAISLTGLFIDVGPVVQVKDPDGRVQHHDDIDRGMAWDGPLVVLTSKLSASASEIFAGAIQDYRRGLIVGDLSTHGKGTVQTLIDLGRKLFAPFHAPKLGALKITIQQFYRPDGDSTQNRGVLADVELPSLPSQFDIGESSLDFAVKFDRVAPADYQRNDLVSKRTVEQLKQLSAARLKSSSDFERVQRNIERYKDQKSRKRVSLNEEKFMADRADLNIDKEEEKQLEELSDPDAPVVRRDYYFNEVLAITEDFLRLEGSQQSASVGRRVANP